MSANTAARVWPGVRQAHYTQCPDELFDELMPDLNLGELKVLLYIVRRTFGFKKQSDDISLAQMVDGLRRADGTQLDRGTGLSKGTVMQAVRSLVEMGVIERDRNRDENGGDLASTYRLRFRSDQDTGEGFTNTTIPPGEKSILPRGSKSDPTRNREQQTDSAPPNVGAGKTENEPKKLPTNGAAQQIVAAFCEAAGIGKPAVYAKAVGQAQQMAKAGVTPEEIPELFAFVSEWAEGVDLGMLLGSVDKWRASKNGRKRPKKQINMRDPNPYTNGIYGYWQEGMGPVSEKAEDWQILQRGKPPHWGLARGGLDSLEDVGR